MRSILKHCFALDTYSKHEPATVRPISDRLATIIGAVPYQNDFFAFVEDARRSSKLHVVKTHDAPETDDPTIYIVRNGVVATDSYRHYLRDWDKQHYAWNELISMPTVHGNWSHHLDAWQPTARLETLMLRYEDLVEHPSRAVDAVSRFLSLPRIREWRDPWSETHRLAPTFFRRGKTSIPLSLSASDIEAFMVLHRPWMDKLRYSASPPKNVCTLTGAGSDEAEPRR